MTRTTNTPVVVFDVNETLLDIAHLELFFERVFGDRAVLREWFAQLVLYSQTMTLSRLYTPFGDLGAGVLRMLADIYQVSVTQEDLAEQKKLMGTMPAYSDVAPALARLSDAGCRSAFIQRPHNAVLPAPGVPQPDIVAPDMHALADRLVSGA